MEEKFNWDLPADPDPKSDNYYNGIISKELKDSSNVGKVLLGVINRESVTNQSDFVNEGIQSILDQFGIKTDKPLTRKEKLLALKPTNLSQERRSSWHSSDLKLAQYGRNWWKTKDSQNQLHPTLSKLP